MSTCIKLCNVLHIPSFRWQLLSLTKVTSADIHVSFVPYLCFLRSSAYIIGIGDQRDNPYILDTTDAAPRLSAASLVSSTTVPLTVLRAHIAEATDLSISYLSSPSTSASIDPSYIPSLQTWHERFAHVHPAALRTMITNNIVDGVLPSPPPDGSTSKGCLLGKSHQLYFSSLSSSRAPGLLDLEQSDVIGPLNVLSIDIARYFLTFMDENY